MSVRFRTEFLSSPILLFFSAALLMFPANPNMTRFTNVHPGFLFPALLKLFFRNVPVFRSRHRIGFLRKEIFRSAMYVLMLMARFFGSSNQGQTLVEALIGLALLALGISLGAFLVFGATQTYRDRVRSSGAETRAEEGIRVGPSF